MQKAIIGKKIGMTQIFDEKGRVVPVKVRVTPASSSAGTSRDLKRPTVPARLHATAVPTVLAPARPEFGRA